ncbi:MAG: MBL fold metallo-hydrolase [Bacillota bacterium]
MLNLPYQLTDNLFVLGHNLFLTCLVKGDPCTLIDLGVSGTAPLIDRQLKQIGVKAEEIGNLIVLHAHWDHVCGLPYLKQLFPEAEVLGSAKAREVLGKTKIVAQFRRNDEFNCSWLKNRKVFAELPDLIEYDTIPIDRVMQDGDKLSLGDVEIQFLETPGHSPCSMSLYLPSEKAAIISDAVGGYTPASDQIIPAFYQSVGLTLTSLDKLAALDAQIVVNGHDTDMIFTGWQDIQHFYQRVKEQIKSMCDEIKQMAASGADEETLLTKIFQMSYRGALAEIYPQKFVKSVSPFLLKAIMNG